MSKTIITSQTVQYIAKLAHIPLKNEEEQKFADGFTTTIGVIDQLNQINTPGIVPTFQVTGLTNVWREDKVDEDRMFSQEQVLMNAQNSFEGYFVVPQIIEQDN